MGAPVTVQERRAQSADQPPRPPIDVAGRAPDYDKESPDCVGSVTPESGVVSQLKLGGCDQSAPLKSTEPPLNMALVKVICPPENLASLNLTSPAIKSALSNSTLPPKKS